MKIKNNKGITLISLGITVIILLILVNVIVYNVIKSMELVDVEKLNSDISNLRGKASNFYSEFGEIPINTNYEYTNITKLKDIKGANDIGKFYILDLSAIENLTLNYGKDFEKYKEILSDVNVNEESKESEINKLTDIYVINEVSHNIFYIKGVELSDNILYTDYPESKKDEEKVEERIINGVIIPNGYIYNEIIDGSVTIKDDTNIEYKWIKVEKKIKDIPTNVKNIGQENKEMFLESVNKYNGYYININTEENAIYI